MRYFVDMDGTLNEWNFNLSSPELLYREGYFLNRPEQKNIVDAVAGLIAAGEDVYILSSVLADSKYALPEKHKWLDRYLCVPEKKRLFPICGEVKLSCVPGFNKDTDILIDDYGENCRSWASNGGRYIKVAVNKEDAKHERQEHRYVISPDMPASEILKALRNI